MKLTILFGALVLVGLIVQKLLELRWPKLVAEPLEGERRQVMVYALATPRGEGQWDGSLPFATQLFSDRGPTLRLPPGEYWLYAVDVPPLDTSLAPKALYQQAGQLVQDVEARFRSKPSAGQALPGNPYRVGTRSD